MSDQGKGLQIAEEFYLPLEAVTRKFGILANSGAGKSVLASRMAEQMYLNGIPFVAIDPLGAWWGMRFTRDGKHPGLPIPILGGNHGDLPITEDMGERIALLLAEQPFSVILDLSLMRKGMQKRFMLEFSEALYHANRSPLHLIVDEANMFAAQKPQPGDQRLLGAMEDIAQRGRFKGIGSTWISQRAALLNKNVLNLIETLMVLRTNAPLDRKALDEWVSAYGADEHRSEFMDSLASLPTGRAWIWSPEWLGAFQQVQVLMRETFDSSATPKLGEAVFTPQVGSKVDLNWLSRVLEVETAPSTDVDVLLSQIESLKHQLSEHKTEYIEVPVIRDDQIRALSNLATSLIEQAQEMIYCLRAITTKPVQLAKKVLEEPEIQMGITELQHEESGEMSIMERNLLLTLAQRPQYSHQRFELAILTHYKPTSARVVGAIRQLNKSGFIEEHTGVIRITEQGQATAGNAGVAEAPEMLRSAWLQLLTTMERNCLEALFSAYPSWLDRAGIADMASYAATSARFIGALNDLCNYQVIQREENRYRASPIFFEQEFA